MATSRDTRTLLWALLWSRQHRHFSDMVDLAVIWGFPRLQPPPDFNLRFPPNILWKCYINNMLFLFPKLPHLYGVIRLLGPSVLSATEQESAWTKYLPRTITHNIWQVTKYVFAWQGKWLGNSHSNINNRNRCIISFEILGLSHRRNWGTMCTFPGNFN